jgi:hypothetical protein
MDELEEKLTGALAADPSAGIRGSWQGPEETAIFIYGGDAERLAALVEPALDSYPLGQNARVVVRFGKPALGPREFRITRRDSV